ncbi:MAG: hypothetical protein HWN81_09210 [Candidatus Lokiarchaeota archaeon]|nr:hypothetical protein [Candidatus Lokiarchaeota archaeon]
MSNWNISTGADDVLVNGLPSSGNNDVGTIRAAGTVGDARFISDAVNLGTSTYITVVSGLSDVESPLAGGAFNAGDQVIVRVTTDLAGVSNNVLLAGASNSANASDSIHQMQNISTYYYKTAVRTGGWNEYSGVFSPAVTVGDAGGWDISLTGDTSATLAASGTDNAANPSQVVPGELQYRDGSPEPIQDEYKAKTNW